MRPSVILLSAFLGYFTPQPSIGQDYFPLQVGNVWYLSSIPDYIRSTVFINSLEYVEVCTPRGCNYYRKDSSGNIYLKSGEDEEMLLYKLAGDVGDEWDYGSRLHFVATLESRTDTVVTAYETFFNCIRISFRGINVIDADHAIWFAPDIGIVKTKSLDWGIVHYLIKAYVNGDKVPAHATLPEIIESIPNVGQSDIPIDASITLKFNLGINPFFVSSDYIQIYSAKNGIISGQFDDDYKYSYYKVIFTPDAPFEYEDTLLVTVSSEIEDYAGDQMSDGFELTFFTEAFAPAPVLFSQDTISNFTKLSWGDFDLGDHDNDGDDDIIIFGTVDSVDVGLFHYIELYRQQDGIFYQVPTEFLPLNPELGGKSCIKWADYNNDDLLDLIYAGEDTLHQTVTLFYRNTGRTFEVDPALQLDFADASMDWSDYNSDGYVDLAIWGYVHQAHTAYAAIYKNDHGNFIKQGIADLPFGSRGIIKWVDYDSDGDSDIITVGRQLYEFSIYENVSGEFQKITMGVESDVWLPYRFNIDFTDLENDGDIDFLIGQYIIRQDNGSLRIDQNPLDLSSTFAKFNDFDNDGYKDLFVVGEKNDPVGRNITYIQVMHNVNGNLIVSKEINLERYLYIYSGTWEDINGDGKIDLIMNTSEGFMIHYNLMNPLDITGVDILPLNITLHQNFPNPFNLSTTLHFDLQVATKVTLIIYDILGREVVRLVDRHIGLGYNQIEWNSKDAYNRNVPSGIYIARLVTPNYTKSIKMLLLK